MIQGASSGIPLELAGRRRRGITGSSSASGAPFNPALMTGIQAWYDFSALALVDGNAITTISDGSGNGHTLTGAATAQPLFKTGANGINSKGVALFDGVNDTLTSASFALAQPFTVYAVIAGGGAGPNRYWGDGGGNVLAGYGTGPDNPNNFAGSALTVVSGTAANPKVVTSVFNGASSLIRIDAAQVASGTVGASNMATGVVLGSSAGTGQFWTGKIAELFYTNVSSVDTGAEAYLKAKWGTP